MVRIRVHGRGGEGAVTFAHILCASATYDGKYGQSCMAAAFERRGAPVEAFGRIGERPIAERGTITEPDIVAVLNPTLVTAVNVELGMNESGMLVVNAPEQLALKHRATYIDARRIALEMLNVPITNTVMLGAFAAATELVTLESLEKAARFILTRFSENKLKANIAAIRAGYDEVKRGQGIH
ncbi:MAG: 2-oxoacid:acceptor oxidoreductase family protein [Dehalococcoidia bacterium]|nr:2-oxoacid:acceptor oxidoreductase family protein [Dehalococcoidia bacterium]